MGFVPRLNGLCPLHLVGALDKRFILSTPDLYPGQLFYPQDNCFIPSSCSLYTVCFGKLHSCGYGSGAQSFGNLLESSYFLGSPYPEGGMVLHCLTLMECSGCTIEFRLQM